MSVLRRPAEMIYCKVEARPKNDGHPERIWVVPELSQSHWQ